MILRTARLILRDHVSEDLPRHHALYSDSVAMRYLPGLMTSSVEESATHLQQTILEQSELPRKKVFLRIELLDGTHVGEIGYTRSGNTADLGYFIRHEFWNRGFTTEAVQELLCYAFEESYIDRMEASCIRENAGSERVMQKCSMSLQHLSLRHTLHEGVLKDRVYYDITRDQWILNRK